MARIEPRKHVLHGADDMASVRRQHELDHADQEYMVMVPWNIQTMS